MGYDRRRFVALQEVFHEQLLTSQVSEERDAFGIATKVEDVELDPFQGGDDVVERVVAGRRRVRVTGDVSQRQEPLHAQAEVQLDGRMDNYWLVTLDNWLVTLLTFVGEVKTGIIA